jgi:ethanolamine utilization protein EutJ
MGAAAVPADSSDGSDAVDGLLAAAAARLDAPKAVRPAPGPLRVGVDLGTANCVLVVLDANDQPVWVDSHPSGALRDGVVVDFGRATSTVALLEERAEQAIGSGLRTAATAYPPCIPVKDARACTYVCEAAGFSDVALVDEVTAAQRTLEVSEGVVVDVGGGSTGVGVFRGGRLVELDDRAGGGHHLDLVLAGALGIPLEEAEIHKREHPTASLPILVPGLQRIAESVRATTRGDEDLPLHLAGGALMLAGAGDVLAGYLERTVVTYPHALLITPIGIARSAP